jgi:GT2 family glycosyltransferase
MKIAIVIPNWNGADWISECLTSLENQTLKVSIIVVDNGSIDNSVELIEKQFPAITILRNKTNLGFAGGVNTGIRYVIKQGFDAVALFNNDAVADRFWLESLANCLEKDPTLGAVASKLLNSDGTKIDSTGDYYSSWGLTIARQRDEPAEQAPSKQELVFGSSAGASLYRLSALQEIGLFDERFFAYYEDTDVSFRLQIFGWKIIFCPTAIVRHATGSTSSKLKGFTTYQTTKNLPMLFWKNVPLALMPRMLPRFTLAYYLILGNSLLTERRWPALKGHLVWLTNIPYSLRERRRIQSSKRVSSDYIWSILHKELPPDADRLRRVQRLLRIP